MMKSLWLVPMLSNYYTIANAIMKTAAFGCMNVFQHELNHAIILFVRQWQVVKELAHGFSCDDKFLWASYSD